MRRIYFLISGGIVFFVGIILFLAAGIDSFFGELAVFLLAYLLLGHDVVIKAVRNLVRGKLLDENFLMAIATIGAFAIGEFAEAAAVMLFYQAGEFFQGYAVNKSRKSIQSLMEIRPDTATVLRDGQQIVVDASKILVGETIVISAGERVALDGQIIKGSSSLDTSALTGESLPRDVMEGDSVLSGSVNLSGLLFVQTTKAFEQSTASKVLQLVENATALKSQQERFITRFAKYYTPIVVGLAVLLALIPPIIVGFSQFDVWLYRALTFLVVSCPCALVISIPMSFFGGIGGASRNGVLFKGANYLEIFAKTNVLMLDKTGTLTKGSFSVTNVVAEGMEQADLLFLAAHAEAFSTHPIAQCIVKEVQNVDKERVQEFEEIAGKGVKARVEGRVVHAGNKKLMQDLGLDVQDDGHEGVVFVAVDGVFAGKISVSDTIKEDALQALQQLRANGVERIVMLTGDRKNAAVSVAEQLQISEYAYELLPEDKLKILLDAKSDSNNKVAFVGDGINDSPVLASADIGFAMGGLGSDAAIEAADAVIMTDELIKLPLARKIARKTLRIAGQNIYFAILIKSAVLILSAFGLANMWLAIFADVGVAVLAILNAMRTLKLYQDSKVGTKTN